MKTLINLIALAVAVGAAGGSVNCSPPEEEGSKNYDFIHQNPTFQAHASI